ncbi:transcriptional activator DEMETER-like [Macadamia integrifolia]|uniref:transcriptional activator DEMETER-like n=1 Tax=Macadamia integrifolia TaxID=60698 RepID=UPI001C52BA96|nr:transcriptional activator DEMETER-like [Macadamia integrifolia]
MDFGRGLSIPEGRQENFQIQGGWIPATPGNPIPTRWLQTSAAEGEGSQVGRTNWLESLGFRPGLSQETPSANGATACFDSMASHGQSRRLANWDSATALAGSSSVSGGIEDGWNNIPYVNLMASVASSSASANLQGSHNAASNPPFFPVYYFASNYNMNQDRSLNSEFWNNSNWQSEPLNGLPVLCHSYDLNSPPKTMADCPSDGVASMPFAPVTPEKGQILQEITNPSAGERSYRKQDKQEVLTSPNGNEIIELDGGGCSQPMRCTNEVTELQTEFSHPQVGTSAAISTTLMENNHLGKAENHDIDLNKTPQQKSRRKKHRPKVIVEGKPKRTPKSVTPNQNPPGKRKYVRKKSLQDSETPSAEAVVEAIDPSPNSSAKSCRRALNFNLEDKRREEHPHTSLDNQEGFLHNSVGSPSSRWLFNLNSESQAQDLSSVIDGGSGTKSTVQLGQGVEVTVNNTPAGLAYDLNCSLNQVIKDYISLPETDPAPQSAKRVPTENSHCISKNRNEMENPCSSISNGENNHSLLNQQAQGEGISRIAFQTGATLLRNEKLMQPLLQCRSQSMSIGENDPNSNLCVPYVENEQARGSKREYSHTIDKAHAQAMNMRGGIQQNSLQTYQEMLQGSGYNRNRNRNNLGLSFPEICKKRRTEKAQHTTPCSSSSTAVNRVGWGQEWQSYHGTADTKFNDMLSTRGPKNRNSKSVRDVHAHSAQTKSFPIQDSTIDPLSFSRTNFSGLQSSGFMLTFGLGERMTKKRSKAPTRVRDLASLIAIPQCTQLPSTPLKTAPTLGERQGTDIIHRPQAGLEAFVAENYAKKKRTRKGTPATLRGRSQVTQTNIVSIDAIVQRLRHLDINGETNRIPDPEQNALVPYNGNGTMVPYEGVFDPTRRRRPRPKVDLDPETDRVWKLLMGKPAIEGMEHMNEKTEKWWEEERRVFQGRADSFIARMHLVQGDRRFSQWKGSVVDSVVGVFLTQNVSDHLSSSAFMSLAARFPLQSKSNKQACFKEGTTTSFEELEVCVLDTEDTIKWHENMPSQLACDQSSMTFHETGHIEEQEVANSNESFGSNLGDGSTDNSRGKELPVCSSSPGMSHDLLPNITESLTKNIGMVNFIQEDRKAIEDAVSSHNSTESSTFQIIERNGSCSDSNSEAEDLVTQSPSKSSSDGLDGCTFTERLQMGRNSMSQEFYNCGNGSSSFNQSPNGEENQSKGMDSDKHRSSMVRIGCLKDSSAYIYPPNSCLPHKQVPIHSSTYSLHVTPNSELLEVQCPETLGEVSRSPLPSSASEITKTKHANSTSKQDELVRECASATTVQKAPSSAQEKPPADLYESLNKHQNQTLYGLQTETYSERNPKSFNHQQRDRMEAFQSENTILGEPTNVRELAGRQDNGMQQVSSLLNFSEVLDAEKGCLEDQEKCRENKLFQSNLKKQVYVSDYSATGSTKNLKAKKEAGKKKEFDWDSLRKNAFENGGKKERSSNTMDSLDWEAVRCANVNEIANAIKERGMNNMLAERIQDFLNRIVREHGSIDLEWLRDVPPDQVKEYLLSIRGLGLKSVECVRLLTLHHLAFPVDTNVGRIAVRLGWVPLQPLPESLQLHLLEMYPVLESIQKYLWPRLCKLDQRTLYELHYQMITFGKVFCTKSKPNCNACPMRGECKHFASAFASARFALPAPEERSVVCSTAPLESEHNRTLGIDNQTVGINTMPLLLPEANPPDAAPENKEDKKSCEPIIEVPATPEPECTEISQSDIEDILDDPDEIPTIKLNIEEFTMNLQNYMNEYSMELQEGNTSQALVALTPEAASIPVPKLKNVSRLRTEHQVYELPDSHPLLEGLDKREPDDPCSYLLAIWTPGETAESIQPPKGSCGAQESGKLCNEKTCFSCNSIREANSQTVRGTLLIPCRTAMRGSFPLNGTYFQVNEVFADHDSSVNPIDVPRSWLWNLSRRTVYFGTSIPTIFKGLTTEGIQHCFWRGFVCVRGFDQKNRAPRPLMARLHFPASKLARTKT